MRDLLPIALCIAPVVALIAWADSVRYENQLRMEAHGGCAEWQQYEYSVWVDTGGGSGFFSPRWARRCTHYRDGAKP